jgi:hypothetical protein
MISLLLLLLLYSWSECEVVVAKGMVGYFYYDYVISWMELLHIVVSWVLMSWTIVPSWEEIMGIDSSYVMGREPQGQEETQPTTTKRD